MLISPEVPHRADQHECFCVCKKLERMIAYIFKSSLEKAPALASPKIRVNRFRELPCSVEDICKIHRLISQMAEENKFHLLIHQAEMRQLGDEIDHVHPMKFLSVILTDAHLKSCLKQIRHDYFKWSNFIDGLSKKLTAFSQFGQTHIYIQDFAMDVGVKPETIDRYFQEKRWADLVIFLID